MRRNVAVLLVLATLCGCTRSPQRPTGDDGAAPLEPQYAPVPPGAAPDGRSPAPTERPAAGGTTTTTTTTGAGPGGAPSSPAAPSPGSAPSTVSITDRLGDLTPSPTDPPPPWADLAGARLTRTSRGWELRIALGAEAPARGDDERTMNVATFFDTDGDGSPDFEVWVNLADTGWGGSWFDNKAGRSRFGPEAGVTVAPAGAELVVSFEPSHLGGAERFRWSSASEWGRYAVLSTPAGARDDVPDNDQPAHFPG